MFQRVAVVKNPYERRGVFTCPHSHCCPQDPKGDVSVYHVMTRMGCHPNGCTQSGMHYRARFHLGDAAFHKLQQELDSYDMWVNLFFGKDIQVAAKVKRVVARYNRHVNDLINGYLIEVEKAKLTEHVLFDRLWVYLGAEEQGIYNFEPGDELIASGRVFSNLHDEHRLELKKVRDLAVRKTGWRWLLTEARSFARRLTEPKPHVQVDPEQLQKLLEQELSANIADS